jgi:RNA polymerase primary sigma factor
MERGTKAAQKQKEAAENEAAEASDTLVPLLDLFDAAVKKLIRAAKKRGYVTHDQISSVSEEVDSEQIENVLAMFSEMGVNVVETEETSEDKEQDEDLDEESAGEGGQLVEARQKVPAKSKTKEPTDRTDDPVRMYLREMGSVELLSREGEVAIAKRIEAGREALIAGLCESPLTFQAIVIWRDELNEGKVLLRDIIDLEATYAGPDAKALPAPSAPDAENALADAPLQPAAVVAFVGQDAHQQPPPAVATPFRTVPQSFRSAYEVVASFKPVPPHGGEEVTGAGEAATVADSETDEDVFEGSISLAAIEAELKPKVFETLNKIADSYKRLRRLQEQDIANRLKNESLSPAQERKYQKLKDEIIIEVKRAGRAALRHQQETRKRRGQADAAWRESRRRPR